MHKTLILVGAGKGIGLAVARRFAREGWTIALVARRRDRLQALQQGLQAAGYSAHCYAVDASDPAALMATIATIQADIGSPGGLVYNAAALRMGDVLTETAEQLVADFRVNVAGALAATQAVLPAMQAAGMGTILFTGGGFALHPSRQFASLSIGKAGIRNLAQTLHEALKPQGIRVGCVTVCGIVNPDDPKYSPDQVAENYWHYHQQPLADCGPEVVY